MHIRHILFIGLRHFRLEYIHFNGQCNKNKRRKNKTHLKWCTEYQNNIVPMRALRFFLLVVWLIFSFAFSHLSFFLSLCVFAIGKCQCETKVTLSLFHTTDDRAGHSHKMHICNKSLALNQISYKTKTKTLTNERYVCSTMKMQRSKRFWIDERFFWRIFFVYMLYYCFVYVCFIESDKLERFRLLF